MVMSSTFDMPGVPVDIAWETFTDIENAPSFDPHMLEVKCLRGHPPAVGSSWKERRLYKGKEIFLTKTITRVSRNENGSLEGLVAVNVEGMRWHSNNAAQICSFVLEPLAGEKWQQSCTASWSMVYIAAGGIYRKTLLAIAKPCLMRALKVHFEKEMQFYYEEALRRAVQEKGRKVEVATEERSSESVLAS